MSLNDNSVECNFFFEVQVHGGFCKLRTLNYNYLSFGINNESILN